MNTTVSARHTASKPSSSSSSSSSSHGGSSNALLPSNTIRRSSNSNNYANGKGRRKSKGLLLVTGVFALAWVGIVFWTGLFYQNNRNVKHHQEHHPLNIYEVSNIRNPRHLKTQQQQQQQQVEVVKKLKGNNPYEGWQPGITLDQDKGHKKCSTWRTCFIKDNPCPGKCRESLEDFGKAPPRPGFTPDLHGDSEDNNEKAQAVEWIPDVTVLRRMLQAGKDEHGNPWPPPLVTEDRELCEKIGVSGGPHDQNFVALNAVPIRGMDLLGNGIDYSTKKMKRAPRILCMVYTMEENHHTNIRAIRETWGPGCDGFLAFSTRDDPRLPAISLPHEGPEEYNNMWQKVRSIWRFVGTHYLEDFDFFFQGGEDMYVLPENLRHYLADAIADPATEDFFGGKRMQKGETSGIFFNSGGAGYALSRATLRKLIETGLDHPQCFPDTRSSEEDVLIARCLKEVFGIGLVDTRDEQDRERFHPLAPATHYEWRPRPEGTRDWYRSFNTLWPPKFKEECCAPDSVSFHYIKQPALVRHIHSLLYFCD